MLAPSRTDRVWGSFLPGANALKVANYGLPFWMELRNFSDEQRYAYFISSSVNRRISGATFSRSFWVIWAYNGYVRETRMIPTSPITMPGTNHCPIQTMAQHIPMPRVNAPMIPTTMETAVPFLVTLRSSLRSCSILSASLGIYFLRSRWTSSCSLAE